MRWLGCSTWVLFLSFLLMSGRAGATSMASEPCGVGITGNVDATGIVDLSDLTLLVNYLIVPGTTLPCPDEANVNAVGIIDVSDLTLLVTYLIIPGTALPPCPNAVVLMSAAARSSALTAAQQQIDNLKGLPTDQFLQQMLAYFQASAAFEASGINVGANNVWARFTDGVGFMVTRSLEFSPDTLPGEALPSSVSFDPSGPGAESHQSAVDGSEPSVSAQAQAGTADDLPHSTSVRIVQSVGNGFPSVSVTTRRLISWFTSNGYYVTSTSGSIASLRQVGGEGVFYFLGHGSVEELPDGLTDYCLSTTNDALTASQVSTNENELAAGRLVFIAAPFDYDNNSNEVWGVRFGITSRFVSKYWHNFAPSAAVFINACRSDSATGFKTAVQAKGGPAYFGWTHAVNSKDACDVAEFMIDRMLGANKHYRKENPAQRPFGVASIYDDLVARGLHTRPNNDADAGFKTVFHYTPGSSNFGLLAPSIKFMSIYDFYQPPQLLIAGLFGTDPGEGDRMVTVGGQELTVLVWTPDMIQCEIPVTGPGSDGPVIVSSRADVGGLTPLTYRESNVVNITSWQGQLRYDRAEAGTLHSSMTVDLHFRTDVHAFREMPHEQPWETIVQFDESWLSNAHAEASGVVSGSVPGFSWSIAWGGTHELGPPFESDDVWGYNGSSIDTKSKKLALNLMAGTNQLTSLTTYIYEPGGTYTYPGPMSLFLDSCLYDDRNMVWTFYIPLDSVFTIPAGSRSCLADPYVNPEMSGVDKAAVTMQWLNIEAAFPPDPTAAR